MRNHNFVVGYEDDKNVVYGKQQKPHCWADPMTLFQAKRMAKNIYSMRGDKKIHAVVYKLVKVNTNPAKD